MLSVTVDTNIYISAFNYRGKPRELIDLADGGVIRLDLSEGIGKACLVFAGKPDSYANRF